MSRLQTVSEREVDADALQREKRAEHVQQQAQAQAQHDVATKMLLMALGALSQRFVIALAALFTLLTVSSAFALWFMALPTMTWNQIIGLSIYSGFVLLVNVYGRQK